MLALILVVVMIGVCVWVAYRATRVPRKSEHERQPERFRDPTEITYRGGSGGI